MRWDSWNALASGNGGQWPVDEEGRPVLEKVESILSL